jgi:hypothetical protein
MGFFVAIGINRIYKGAYMLIIATFPKKVRVKCEVCEKEYLLDKVWYNNNGYNCCEPLREHQKSTNEITKKLKQDEILEFSCVNGVLEPKVIQDTQELMGVKMDIIHIEPIDVSEPLEEAPTEKIKKPRKSKNSNK